MDAPIRGETHAISSLFSDRFRFTIPYFQRGYCWQEEHAQRLLANLCEFAIGERQLDWYPLGFIILTWPGPGHDAEIADGHQRIATLTIVMACLRDLEPDPARRSRLSAAIFADDGTPRLKTQAWGQALLHDLVQRDGATLLSPSDATGELSPSEEAILDNREFIRRTLGAMTPEQRWTLAEFILDRTFIVVMAVADKHAAPLLFSTIHETGLRTEDVDLLKSRMLGQCNDDARENARGIWEGLEVRLGKERLDGLLRHVSLLKLRGRSQRADDAIPYAGIDFEDRDAVTRFLLDEFRPHGSMLATMLNAGLDAAAQPGPAMRRLQYLGWVTRHDTWRLPALHWLHQRRLGEAETLAFLKRLEALAWVQMITAADIPRRDRRYLAIADEIDRGRALEAGASLAVTPTEREAVRRVLADQNFFRRPYKMFLMLRLNAIYEGDEEVHVAPEATVEHIMPQRPAPRSLWRIEIEGQHGGKAMTHALGNLAPLTEGEQQRAGNSEFEQKKLIYRDSSFVLSRQIVEYNAWSREAIESRGQRLINDFLADLGLA